MLRMDLSLEYPDVKTAESVMKALGPDNEGYVESELDGCTVRFRIEADNAGSMRNTCDDLLACVKIAEEAIGISSKQ